MSNEELIEFLKEKITNDKKTFNEYYKIIKELEEKKAVKKFLDSDSDDYETAVKEGNHYKFYINLYAKTYLDARRQLDLITIGLLSNIKLLLTLEYPGYINSDSVIWDRDSENNELNTATITFSCGKIGSVTKARLMDNEVILMVKELKPLGYTLSDVGSICNYNSNMQKRKIFSD